MINASQIKGHMEVKGSDGMDHYIDIATVDAIEGDRLRLSMTAEEAVRTWH